MDGYKFLGLNAVMFAQFFSDISFVVAKRFLEQLKDLPLDLLVIGMELLVNVLH